MSKSHQSALGACRPLIIQSTHMGSLVTNRKIQAIQPGWHPWLGLAWGLAMLAAGSQALACATCGCALANETVEGFTATAGWRLSLQVDYLNQDQLRSGGATLTTAQVAALNTPAPGAGQEVEHQTLNRYTTLGLSYAPDAEWNLRLLLPWIDRSHSTYGSASNPVKAGQLSRATVAGPGDLKVIANYQGFLPGHNLGLQFGLKLPTGAFGGQSLNGGPSPGRHPAAFGPSGSAGGMLLDASLQAGTGSTDLIVGGHATLPVTATLSVFATFQVQVAVHEGLNQPGADFRPGNQDNLTLGLRWEGNPACVPQLQLNVSHRGADQGALADTSDSEGTVAYLSPGLNVSLSQDLHAFAFVQVPFASSLAGIQLAPRWTVSAGLACHF